MTDAASHTPSAATRGAAPRGAAPRSRAVLGTALLACLAASPLASAAKKSAAPAVAAVPAPAAQRSPQEILDASPASAWRDLDPANVLVMQVPAGRVVIELAPTFAPAHVGNIRTLATEHFWDGLSLYRSQDNFVVQFGDADADSPTAKPLGSAKRKLPAEFERALTGVRFDALPDPDGWSAQAGFVDGFPAARDDDGHVWMAHCYGTLGAGRDIAADSSIGAELYVVTGQSPRQLDRNITVVGRVVQGMDYLSILPRGTGAMGFYEDAKQRATITSIALASSLPEAERPRLQALRTDSPTFAEVVETRRNRRDPFYKRPAGHIDVCNVTLPVRVVAGK